MKITCGGFASLRFPAVHLPAVHLPAVHLPTVHLPFGLADMLLTDHHARTRVHELSLVLTSLDDHGWRVFAAAEPTVVLGFIRADNDSYGVQFDETALPLYRFDSFDSALDYFAEYVWASQLGLSATH